MLLLTILSILSKFAIYLGLAMILGGLFIDRLLRHVANINFSHRHYIQIGCALGFTATIINFFLQVGNFAEEGIPGIWNPLFVEMLWLSSIGDSVMVRLAGFVCVGISYYISLFATTAGVHRNWRRIVFQAVLVFGLLLLLYSFTLTGHLAEHPSWLRLLLALHVFVVLGWIGALYPLRNSAAILPIHHLQSIIQNFGKVALLLVCASLIAGLVMAWNLFSHLSTVLTQPYGQLLAVKLTLVAVMLLFALRHRYLLVPALQQPGKVYQLRQSLIGELLVGLSVLMVTMILTTAFSPN